MFLFVRSWRSDADGSGASRPFSLPGLSETSRGGAAGGRQPLRAGARHPLSLGRSTVGLETGRAHQPGCVTPAPPGARRRAGRGPLPTPFPEAAVPAGKRRSTLPAPTDAAQGGAAELCSRRPHPTSSPGAGPGLAPLIGRRDCGPRGNPRGAADGGAPAATSPQRPGILLAAAARRGPERGRAPAVGQRRRRRRGGARRGSVTSARGSRCCQETADAGPAPPGGAPGSIGGEGAGRGRGRGKAASPGPLPASLLAPAGSDPGWKSVADGGVAGSRPGLNIRSVLQQERCNELFSFKKNPVIA